MSLIINSNTTITESTSGYWQLPVGTTAQRPPSPVIGMTRFNTDIQYIEMYNGNGWDYFNFRDSVLPETVTFALQEDTGFYVTDNITKNGTIVVSGINVVNGTWQYSTNSGSTWSSPQPVSTNTFVLFDGVYSTGTIHVRQINAVGYSSTTTNAYQIVVDNTGPIITITTAGNSSNILDYVNIGTADGTIAGTVNTVVDTITLMLGNVARTVAVNGLTWSYNFNYSDLQEIGLGYNRTIFASDIAGNNTTSTVVGVNFVGSKVFYSSQTWTVPTGVRYVSAVAVGAGQNSGGSLGWKNNIPVTPGQQYQVQVGVPFTGYLQSFFISTATVSGSSDGFIGDGGGRGGYGGGGGAGGYTGDGGNQGSYGSLYNGPAVYAGSGQSGQGGGGGGGGGGVIIYYNTYPYGRVKDVWPGGTGGGVGLYGQGSSGSGGSPATSATNAGHGGGGSSGQSGSVAKGGNYGGGSGGNGAVRVVWGLYRSFPSNDVASSINES